MTAYAAARQSGTTGTGVSFSNLRWVLMFGKGYPRQKAGRQLARLMRLPAMARQAIQVRKEADAVRQYLRR